MPGRQIFGIRQAAEEIADVGVGLGIGHQHGVVDVPGLLPPRIEDDLLPGVVRVQRGDHALDRVIEQHRADADAHVELEAVGVGEERLVLADGLALVVEDRPAAAHPARADVVRRHLRLAIRAHDDLPVCIAPGHRSRLGLDLLLDLAAKAVGVGEAELDFGLLARPPGRVVRLAGQGIDDGRLRVRLVLCALVREQVVHKPGGGALQDGVRIGEWILQVIENDRLGQVGLEALQRISFDRAGSGLPMTAVPTTMPRVSKATRVRLPFGSVIQYGLKDAIVDSDPGVPCVVFRRNGDQLPNASRVSTISRS